MNATREPWAAQTPTRRDAYRQRRSLGAKPLLENVAVAVKLRDYADLLDEPGRRRFPRTRLQKGSGRRLQAGTPVGEILAKEGRDGLVDLPAIGTGIAGAIAEMAATGRWSQLERLRGEMEPEALFRRSPGIGPQYAHRLAEDGQLESLEDLETAIHSGTLHIKGIGPRRKEMIGQPSPSGSAGSLDCDDRSALNPCRQCRCCSRSIACTATRRWPASFAKSHRSASIPSGEAWLPVLHARHDNWHFTAFFSNTSLAHQLARTRDWVVIYFQAEGQPEGRCTVVTEPADR